MCDCRQSYVLWLCTQQQCACEQIKETQEGHRIILSTTPLVMIHNKNDRIGQVDLNIWMFLVISGLNVLLVSTFTSVNKRFSCNLTEL